MLAIWFVCLLGELCWAVCLSMFEEFCWPVDLSVFYVSNVGHWVYLFVG